MQGLMLPFLGWLTGAIFFLYAWVLRVAPSVMIEELMRDFAVGAAAIGNLSAFYFYGYAGFQIPIGMMIDRFGPRRLMTIAAIACGAGCVVSAVGMSLGAVSAGRFLIGATAAFSLVGAMAVAGQWFPPNRFAVLSGWAMLFGMSGGVLGQAPLRILVDDIGWRQTYMVLAVGGVAIALAAWLTVRDRARGSGGLRQVLGGLKEVTSNRQTWIIAIAGLGTTGPLLGFAGLWGVPYLSVAHGLERTTAATITSMLFLGWGIGAPILGWLSDRIGVRRPVFAGGLAIALATLALLVYAPPLPPWALVLLCMVCGFGGSGQIVGFAAAREANPARFSGTTIGFVNGVVTAAGALYQPLLGWLLDLAWSGEMRGGVRYYDVAAFRLAFLAVLGGTAFGLLCALSMRETYCRPLETEPLRR